MKNKYFYIVLLVLLLTPTINSYGQQIKKTVDIGSNNIRINSLIKNGVYYNEISLNNAAYNDKLGEPNLPIYNFIFYIPINHSVTDIEFISLEKENIQLEYDILPIQRPIPISIENRDTAFYLPNKLIYKNNNLYPSINAQITNIDYFDGDLKLVRVVAYPMQYNPVFKKLFYNSRYQIIVHTAIDNCSKNIRFHPKKRNKECLSILKSIVDNPETVTTDSMAIFQIDTLEQLVKVSANSTLNSIPFYEYVIITDQSLTAGFNEFVKWKKQKGIDIGIVTTDDIYSSNTYATGDLVSTPPINDNAGKIRQYLHDAKFQGNTKWVLLAGDYNTNLPVKKTSTNVPTDLYFADLHGNWNGSNPINLADVYVGRLICSTISDIQNWAKKVILYEQNPGKGNYNYLLKTFSVQTDQMQENSEAQKSVKTYLTNFIHEIRNEYPRHNSIFDSNGYCGAEMGKNKGADVVAELNNNKYSLISWFCHGGTGGGTSGISTMSSGVNGHPYWKFEAQDDRGHWDTQQQTGNGIDNLNNADYPSILYSISCTVMPFDITSNYGNNGGMNSAEAFTLFPQTGGVAFLGNTRDGYVGSSTEMYKKFLQNIISNEHNAHIGIAEFLSRYQYNSTHISNTHNLIGCPEMKMWTAVPQKFTNISVIENSKTITINTGNLSGYKICVVSANDNGSSYFQTDAPNNTFFNVPSPYTVTITKHNYIPYIFHSDYFIQNEVLDGDLTIYGKRVWAGSNVTPSKPQGPVIIKQGANVIIDADNDVNLEAGFEIESDTEFEIK